MYYFIVYLDLVHVVVKIMLVKGRDLGSPRLPGTVVDLLVVIPMNMIVQGMHIGVLSVGFDKIGPFFWHFMLLALPFFWQNYANFYALLAEKCSLMLDILNSNSVKHDLTINLITMAEYVPGMAAKIAGTLSYECIPTSIQSHAQRTTGTLSCTCTAPVRWKPNCIIKFLNNFASMALCQNSKKMLFMWEENARKSWQC